MNTLREKYLWSKVLPFGYLFICLTFILLGKIDSPYWMTIPMFISIPTLLSLGLFLNIASLLFLDKLITDSDTFIFVNIGIHIFVNVAILYYLGNWLDRVITKFSSNRQQG